MDQPVAVDRHAEVVMEQVAATLELIARFADEPDPAAAVERALVEAVDALTLLLAGADIPQVLEATRIAALPWGPPNMPISDPGSTAARAELVALVALASTNKASDCESADVPAVPGPGSLQPVTNLVSGQVLPAVDEVLRLAQLHEMSAIDPSDPLAFVGVLMRGSEIFVRNNSYPEMLEELLRDLFSVPAVDAILRSSLGFEAAEALAVLKTCHEMQVDGLNNRMQRMGDAVEAAMRQGASPKDDSPAVEAARAAWTAAWEPSHADALVAVRDLAAEVGIPEQRVQTVLDTFALDLAGTTPLEVVSEFARGGNPLRTNPVLVFDGGAMLVHGAHVLGAIREGLEQHLKSTASWDTYQKHRGEVLERRTHDAIARVLPGAVFRDGLEYYTPSNDTELAGPPDRYTKRVEGDHLIVQDDVAFIVEDKAVAVSPSSRAGETRRLRRDLTGIVTKAAEQAGRLQQRIEQDGGVRMHGEGWVDLSGIREIHTIAVSLDDLTGVSTATAELVQAGVLNEDTVPWTVSILDLELICQLVAHPAELLLYLRRRRNPMTTLMFTAPDELDLLLYFFSDGLWVEIDPDLQRQVYPWLGKPAQEERRRFEAQEPQFITSRTDDLDVWYRAQVSKDLERSSSAPASELSRPQAPHRDKHQDEPPKPAMAPSPIRPFIDQLQSNGSYGWLSISATLLSGAQAAQEAWADIPREMLDNPRKDGRGRSVTMPLVSTDPADGWLLVWMTLTPDADRDEEEERAREYVRAKKHQLGIPRGVAILFSEETRGLVSTFLEDQTGPLEPELAARAERHLRPPDDMHSWASYKTELRGRAQRSRRDGR